MLDDQINPYRPPDSAPAIPPVVADKSLSTSQRITTILVWLAVGGYFCFTVVLLRSGSSGDHRAGLLFLWNFPPLIAWLIVTTLKSHWSPVLGYASALAQVAILVVMLVMDMGDPVPVISINSVIALAFAVVSMMCHRISRPSTLMADELT